MMVHGCLVGSLVIDTEGSEIYKSGRKLRELDYGSNCFIMIYLEALYGIHSR